MISHLFARTCVAEMSLGATRKGKHDCLSPPLPVLEPTRCRWFPAAERSKRREGQGPRNAQKCGTSASPAGGFGTLTLSFSVFPAFFPALREKAIRRLVRRDCQHHQHHQAAKSAFGSINATAPAPGLDGVRVLSLPSCLNAPMLSAMCGRFTQADMGRIERFLSLIRPARKRRHVTIWTPRMTIG